MELLSEITQPALRDMKVEFRGLETARVYPERLPNLPLGTQQIILGRYMPADGVRDRDQGDGSSPAPRPAKPVRTLRPDLSPP